MLSEAQSTSGFYSGQLRLLVNLRRKSQAPRDKVCQRNPSSALWSWVMTSSTCPFPSRAISLLQRVLLPWPHRQMQWKIGLNVARRKISNQQRVCQVIYKHIIHLFPRRAWLRWPWPMQPTPQHIKNKTVNHTLAVRNTMTPNQKQGENCNLNLRGKELSELEI